MAKRTGDRRGERGVTLLEAMIALSILLVGLLGMARLQIWGMSATQGARAQTIATQLAAELGAGLMRLDAKDPRLSGASGATSSTPPSAFGRLLQVGTTGSLVHTFDDANPVPGARLSATLERDPSSSADPVYQRRWTVWDVAVTSSGTASKVIAVSVIWRERTLPVPREVVLYVHSEAQGSYLSNINAFN
jgi:type IV pilus assembly protein PilV